MAPPAVAMDRRRDEELRATGLVILRYSAVDVMNNIEGVSNDILEHMLQLASGQISANDPLSRLQRDERLHLNGKEGST